MNASKSDNLENEKRNKLLAKHNNDTKAENVAMSEQIIAIKAKLKAVESERDEYVQMIEANKAVIQRLNIEINQERDHLQKYASEQKKEAHLLNDLRSEMQRIQSVNAQKYERLQREKNDEKVLRISAEQRNEELSLEIGSSTQPLL